MMPLNQSEDYCAFPYSKFFWCEKYNEMNNEADDRSLMKLKYLFGEVNEEGLNFMLFSEAFGRLRL